MTSRLPGILAATGSAALLATAGLVAQADSGGRPGSTPSPSGTAVTVSSTPPTSAHTPSEASADDNGGELDRDQRHEPGDDRDVNGSGPVAEESDDSDDDDAGRGRGRGRGRGGD